MVCLVCAHAVAACEAAASWSAAPVRAVELSGFYMEMLLRVMTLLITGILAGVGLLMTRFSIGETFCVTRALF